MSGWTTPDTGGDRGGGRGGDSTGGSRPPAGSPAAPTGPPMRPPPPPGTTPPPPPPPGTATGWGGTLPPPPSGGPQATRPLTVGDVIETMFSLLRATFKHVAAVSALLGLPGLVLLGLGLVGFGELGELFFDPTVAPMDPDDPTTSFDIGFGDVPPAAIWLLLAGALLVWIGNAAVVPALMKVGVDHWNDQAPSIGASIRLGLKRVWGIATVWLAMLLAVIALLVVPAVLAQQVAELALLYLPILLGLVVFGPALIMVGYLVPAAVVAEDRGAWSALGRVRRLLRGNFWPTYGRGILIGVLLGLVSTVFSFVSNFLVFLPTEILVVFTILSLFANYLVVTPLGVYGGLSLYGDLRIRSEGADVLALASRLQR